MLCNTTCTFCVLEFIELRVCLITFIPFLSARIQTTTVPSSVPPGGPCSSDQHRYQGLAHLLRRPLGRPPRHRPPHRPRNRLNRQHRYRGHCIFVTVVMSEIRTDTNPCCDRVSRNMTMACIATLRNNHDTRNTCKQAGGWS